jgi:hypothetical protein
MSADTNNLLAGQVGGGDTSHRLPDLHKQNA